MRAGDRVTIHDGLGNVIVEQATVSLGTIDGIVYVCEKTNGRVLHYGIPVSAVEPVKINVKPTLDEVIMALWAIFLGEQKGN